ncbi:DUF362 domain-containing protein [candidate division KSB1 bacterium]|nr:DUF362 domain-containing protein [candidate division KSB1 bacterium]
MLHCKTSTANDNSPTRTTKQNRMPKIILLLFGFLSLIWFLIRVIPKPNRAMYPCQRIAFPVASGFVLWLVGLVSSVALFKKFTFYLRIRRGIPAFLMVVLLLGALGFAFFHTPSLPAYADDDPFVPTDSPNSPMGTAQGIFPGRVVWAHNPEATSWNGSGYWSDDKYTNQAVVDAMLSQSLRDLTATKTDAAAWETLFRYFNRQHGYGDIGYQMGEKIAIKINLNACNTHSSARNSFYSSPQVVLAMLEQLVEHAGVTPADITFFDATRFIPKEIFDKCKSRYPNVILADWEGGDGRVKVQRDMDAQLHFSQKLTLEPDGGNPTYVPACVSQAKYLINMGQLKGHNLAGVTLNGKNLFGSIMSYPPNNIPQSSAPKNAGLHPYICVHSDFHFGGHWDFDKRAMGTYNSIADLMGYKHLGAKTMLFLIDGLHSAPDQSTELKKEHKWASFDSDWPNSLFLSQDFIAIESVCLDFLRNEPGQGWVRGNVDNYLHEAALAHNPPSGIKYDPEQDGTPLNSLGVHEHWNNATDKKYTRNLGIGDGIELIVAGSNTAVADFAETMPMQTALVQNYPNPFNAQTKIRLFLAQDNDVEIAVYNVKGEFVTTLMDGFVESGEHHIVWNGTSATGRTMPSGFYIVRLTTDHQIVTHRITLLK